MKKRIFTTFLTIFFSLALSIPALAVDINEGEYRIQRGLTVKNTIPEEYIDQLSEATVNELLNGGPIEVCSVDDFNIGGNGELTTYETTASSDLSVVVLAQRIYEYGSGYDNFKFVASALWNTDPSMKFTDIIALSWSDEFTLYDHYGYELRQKEADSSSYFTITDPETMSLHDFADERGISYNYDMRELPVGVPPYQISMVAKVYILDASGTANVSARYAHTSQEIDAQVEFGLPPSFSVVGDLVDVMETTPASPKAFEY